MALNIHPEYNVHLSCVHGTRYYIGLCPYTAPTPVMQRAPLVRRTSRKKHLMWRVRYKRQRGVVGARTVADVAGDMHALRAADPRVPASPQCGAFANANAEETGAHGHGQGYVCACARVFLRA